MAKVRVLDEATINKIAAGEVIERPASVLKELIENSLDSGAGSVSIHIVDGGRKSITVRDDGCGMSSDDAVAAFQRHATSKISGIEDLSSLVSYGFRGEALSSIASVSRMTLRTSEHGAGEGTEVIVQGGKLASVNAVGCPPGTEVKVDELFHNVPARRKSIKSRATELAHCKDVVINYMLSRPGISFSLSSDGSTELMHSSAEEMNGSLAVTFGSKVAENIIRGEAEAEGLRVEMYLGRLEHSRASPSELRIFVNNRPVRSPKIVSAIVAGYGSRLMKDRYPVGAIRLFAEPSALDVNVHPTKREVRFDDENLVLDLVKRCVNDALKEPDLTYRYDLTRFSEAFSSGQPLVPQHPDSSVQSSLELSESSSDDRPSMIVPLAQIMDTYILAESRGNLLLIDQHAASERVVYEDILDSMRTGKEISQRLLTPLVITLTSSEETVLEENRDILAKAGFSIEPFGKNAFSIRSIPTVLGVAQGEPVLRRILDELSQTPSLKRLGLEIIWRVACHTAIRAGDTLSRSQMRQLLSDLMKTESPYTCEHGRPTMVVLSPADLEKLFKRRV